MAIWFNEAFDWACDLFDIHVNAKVSRRKEKQNFMMEI
jgi:hypothetical protein